MANAFSKEEFVKFEDLCEKFDDALVLSRNVSVYNTDGQEMERAGDTIWRPQPYIAQSFSGLDQSSNFGDSTQLSVPASLGFLQSSPWTMTSKDRRDALQEGRLGEAAAQKLASDVNVSLMNVAAQQGTLVVKRTAAASGFTDIAEADALMNEQGVQMFERYAALSSRDYNNMAANLANASRSFAPGNKSSKAYERAYVGDVAGFETFKLDYANSLIAAAGNTVTIDGAGQYYTPAATSTAATGETSNVDNRYQTITIDVTSGTVKVGDCFTIEAVYAVHHITKQPTSQLKTYRIHEIVTGSGGSGTVKISPPIISGGGGTAAELAYKNVDSTPANGAAITFLNTATASVNPFWQKDALEILPGTLAIDSDAGSAVISSRTAQGIELVWQKWFDIKTSTYLYRMDCHYGVVCKQPEMAGIILFGQS